MLEIIDDMGRVSARRHQYEHWAPPSLVSTANNKVWSPGVGGCPVPDRHLIYFEEDLPAVGEGLVQAVQVLPACVLQHGKLGRAANKGHRSGSITQQGAFKTTLLKLSGEIPLHLVNITLS